MTGFFDLPPRFAGDVKIFRYSGLQQAYLVWNKPRSSMVFMVAIAGGGGGGGGHSRSSTQDGGGGGGGACSGMARFLCPAAFLPDTMYVSVGLGGAGGAATVNGGAGLNSYILASKTAVLPNMICYSGVNAPGGGLAGTLIAAGTGGTIPTIAIVQPTNIWGIWAATVGVAGAAGGTQAGAAGTNVTAWAALPLSPGAGGGGSTSGQHDGGAQSATAITDLGHLGYITAAGGNLRAQGTGAGGNGNAGLDLLNPFFACGGSGGATYDAGQGGHGGAGGVGCGGGGGGAGVTGGTGGKGGDGLVMIVAW